MTLPGGAIDETETSIITKYVAGQDNRTEVHLPKAKATSRADPNQAGDKDDAYYIDKDGKYPFAIMIPERVAEGGKFTPVTERVKIDMEYPDFSKWADSFGKECTDWYLNYQPSKQQRYSYISREGYATKNGAAFFVSFYFSYICIRKKDICATLSRRA